MTDFDESKRRFIAEIERLQAERAVAKTESVTDNEGDVPSVTDNTDTTVQTVTDNTDATMTPRWHHHCAGFLACQTCGDRFTPERADSKYCSSKCRQKAYRQRRKS